MAERRLQSPGGLLGWLSVLVAVCCCVAAQQQQCAERGLGDHSAVKSSAGREPKYRTSWGQASALAGNQAWLPQAAAAAAPAAIGWHLFTDMPSPTLRPTDCRDA